MGRQSKCLEDQITASQGVTNNSRFARNGREQQWIFSCKGGRWHAELLECNSAIYFLVRLCDYITHFNMFNFESSSLGSSIFNSTKMRFKGEFNDPEEFDTRAAFFDSFNFQPPPPLLCLWISILNSETFERLLTDILVYAAFELMLILSTSSWWSNFQPRVKQI